MLLHPNQFAYILRCIFSPWFFFPVYIDLIHHQQTALILIIVWFSIVGYFSTARKSKASGKGGKQYISLQASDTEIVHVTSRSHRWHRMATFDGKRLETPFELWVWLNSISKENARVQHALVGHFPVQGSSESLVKSSATCLPLLSRQLAAVYGIQVLTSPG